LAEAWRSAWAAKVPTALVAVLVAAMCVTTGLTAGRAAAAQAQVEARMEEAGARHLSVVDARDNGFLTTDVIAQVAGLSNVERAVGFSTAFDAVNAAIGPGGERVPTWTVIGELADAVELTWGRWPEPGEALVSAVAMVALGLEYPIGAVAHATAGRGISLPIVGTFTARAPLTHLDSGVVVRAATDVIARRLDVVSATAAAAPVTTTATLAILARSDPNDLLVTSPATLAQIQADVLGDLAEHNQGLVLLTLAAGALLVAVVTLADVLVRRTEIGRRRALGAPRWALVSMLIARAVIGGLLGAGIGTAVAIVAIYQTGQTPDPTFTAATAVLAIIATIVATSLPAMMAAHQDPVRVLRTP